MSKLKAALDAAGMQVRKYSPDKARCITLDGSPITLPAFVSELVRRLGPNLSKHADAVSLLGSGQDAVGELFQEYFSSLQVNSAPKFASLPPELSHLILNVDMTKPTSNIENYFCSSQGDERRVVEVSGAHFIKTSNLSSAEYHSLARAVVPKYMPRKPPGVHVGLGQDKVHQYSFFNEYIQPSWWYWKKNNPEKWDALPASPPAEVIKLLKHLIPIREERNYFYAWVYTSITSRAYVYLVLQGVPGVGKNRLKLLLQALHGVSNSADGKKETLGANQSKFNSQVENKTLVWFDELSYNHEMEPRMKEYQNDSISIERKGVDATNSSQIYCSMVISNNYPRDNYILFNSRKFAPLVLGSRSLKDSKKMTPGEIARMSEKLDEKHAEFDPAYVAQIAKWILTVGKKYCPQRYPKKNWKWLNLEYQGPKFWELAHASMSRWQKSVVAELTTKSRLGPSPGWDAKQKAFLWSKVEEGLRRRKTLESKDYRDPLTVKAFFDNYCDLSGKKIFKTEDVLKSATYDFWIYPIGGMYEQGSNPLIEMLGGEKEIEEIQKEADDSPAPKPRPEKTKLEKRPVGVSMFQWRKLKEQRGKHHEEKENRGVSRGRDRIRKEAEDL